MAPKPPSSDDQKSRVGGRSARACEEACAATPRAATGGKAADKPADDEDDEDEDDDELELDDDDDEDLVVFTAKEAAGAMATIYAFVKPFLRTTGSCWRSSASASWSRRCSTSSCR